MPRLGQLPRTRRRRAAITLGLFLVTIGGALVAAVSTLEALVHPVFGVGLVVLLLGVAVHTWGRRGILAATRADTAGLAGTDFSDGLPAGAFFDDGRIGVRSQGLWTKVLLPVLGSLMLLLGALIALAAGADTEMLLGGCGVMLLGLMMFWVLYRTGGTVLWIDRHGLTRARPPAQVRWQDLTGSYLHRNALHLRTRSRHGLLRRRTVVVPVGVLEIGTGNLITLIGQVRSVALGLPPGTPMP
ncbi:MAG TPA: hypothetical protein H9815_10035 [Candidatus Ruania gallistercoris]|uniref:Uncharacterized protein n=1 Tax=Candidatus Ruania gallistercoris TaxID=2838746 RepID=A0A9D2EEY1_9MICO|nr:hypothetical protein [Candidatus Ruania gallistercoris]